MKRDVELSERLKALANMVTPGNRVCDVGCDHGYLSIYLIQKKISPRVIAMDVRTGPLNHCREHIREYGLEEYIDTRLSDGLSGLLAGEADAVVCAGMGGRLMQRILKKQDEKAQSLKELILQPQSEVKAFREFLRSRGYLTVAENMIEEEGKFYPMMKVVPSQTPVPCKDPLFDRFGELLVANGNPVLMRYLSYRRGLLLGIRKNVAAGDAPWRLQEIDEELGDIRRALVIMGKEIEG